MHAFEMADLIREQAAGDGLYHEFFKIPSLSMGLYVLPAGSKDPQSPHDEDEVYYVVMGQAMIHVAGEDRPVREGSTVFVAAHDEHRFHSIAEDLTLLVFFAPPEGSMQAE